MISSSYSLREIHKSKFQNKQVTQKVINSMLNLIKTQLNLIKKMLNNDKYTFLHSICTEYIYSIISTRILLNDECFFYRRNFIYHICFQPTIIFKMSHLIKHLSDIRYSV